MSSQNEWQQWLASVQPLKRKALHPDFHSPRKEKNLRRIAACQANPQTVVGRPKALNFALDEALFRQFCQQKVPIERELDLHGYYVAEALRYLDDVLSLRCNRRWAFWIVVHGKGREGISDLKTSVWQYLQQHEACAALAPIWDSQKQSGSVIVALRPRPKP